MCKPKDMASQALDQILSVENYFSVYWTLWLNDFKCVA